eukprot:GHRR01011457.1.p3 GENE.GHRR01011457.1~~GHRR01011457.1.p3  ORF type:complete len:118 (+),score=26.88 GHRR01011457.1:1450-1803(+)
MHDAVVQLVLLGVSSPLETYCRTSSACPVVFVMLVSRTLVDLPAGLSCSGMHCVAVEHGPVCLLIDADYCSSIKKLPACTLSYMACQSVIAYLAHVRAADGLFARACFMLLVLVLAQ